MKKYGTTAFFVIATAIIIYAFSIINKQPSTDPWTQQQLLEPSELAQLINDGKDSNIHIFCIGPSATIKNSIEIGEGSDKDNIEKLRQRASNLPREANIVIYCGCCPFKNCPNIRPAFSLLNEMKFTNHKLLNLSTNLKVDWLNKSYPTQ